MNWIEFKNSVNSLGISISEEQINQFKKYLSLLVEWNEKMNLTAITKEEEIIEKHFYDSIYSVKEFSYDDQSLLDVGSGAGFPGIPLKIIFPNLFVTLLEPTNKRVSFLNEVIKQLNLKGIVTINKRAEDYVKDVREYYDIVTARAVANMQILMELSIPLLRVGGTFIALKGSKGMLEHEESKNAQKELNIELIKAQIWSLDLGDKRINLYYTKKKETSLKYPRVYGQIKKKPL